ncbi:NADPH-dependent FMN reductase [Paenibacillus sp. CECT 9249]|uniref:NADPH-dependent FMN reductase n=1 Tax=Paenibacillus sp. CECT 9249 TaxID=2845385 RepID=UPI001E5ED35C|nr:NADPH-dependent FMN reductase [Paenibacillus sp. CECT 9249]
MFIPPIDFELFRHDENAPGETVLAFKRQIAEAEAVLIATPEYNWSIPSVLKNALDWSSRVEKVMIGKPTMVIGATQGMLGTIRAQLHLREILASSGVGARLMPTGASEFLINNVQQKFDESGRFTDEPTLALLDKIVRQFVDFAQAK